MKHQDYQTNSTDNLYLHEGTAAWFSQVHTIIKLPLTVLPISECSNSNLRPQT